MSEPRKPGEPVERSGTLIEPSIRPSVPQSGRPQPVERSGTLIETDDDIGQASLSGHKGRQPGRPIAVDPPCSGPAAATGTPCLYRYPVPPDGAAAGGRADGV
jgi:hypothetical protein